MRVLLVVDLEGIAGVDEVADLVAGSPGYTSARRRLTEEVLIVSRALEAAGFDHVRVSDSHICGSGEPNVLADELDPFVELRMEEDPYGDEMFDHVDAVACLGMHAAAGTSGFAAHTVNLHSRWRQGERRLSETDLVMGLSAERGLPFLFATGDEVLAASMPPSVPFLVTKTWSQGAWRSVSRSELRLGLEGLARAGRGLVLPAPEPRPIEIRFKSRWQADLADTGAVPRTGPFDFEVSAPSFRECYRMAWDLTERAAEGLEGCVRGELGAPEFVEDVQALLRRGFEHARVSVEPRELERARDAFLRLTEGPSSESRALRALILHMLEHHAPSSFEALGLRSSLDQALAGLARVPASLERGLEADELQARVDARYLEHRRGLPGPRLDPIELETVLADLETRGDELYAFILGSMSAAMGLSVPPRFLEAPKTDARVLDLYISTHRLLFESDYLTRPLAVGVLNEERERLLLAAPFVSAEGHADLAAEMAILLQSAGEHLSEEHAQLVALVRKATSADGVVHDGSLGVPAAEMADHATGLGLLMLAGASDRYRG